MTKKKNYKPNPLDTSDVSLPSELYDLAEFLAKNVHEVWAMGRLSEGWSYGPVRDDSKKQTPCLVPYEDLTEEEKAYDYNTAIETLKSIISLGFTIIKK